MESKISEADDVFAPHHWWIKLVDKIWTGFLVVGLLLLFGRFAFSCASGAQASVLCAVFLVGGSALAFLGVNAAAFAFVAFIPVVTGLAQSTLLKCANPLALLVIGLVAGLALNKDCLKADCHRGAFATIFQLVIGNRVSPKDFGLAAVDLLISIILISTAVQVWGHKNLLGFSHLIWNQPTFAFGDTCYFLESALLWTQGLLFFRIVLRSENRLAHDLRPIFGLILISIAVFFFLQVLYAVPPPFSTDPKDPLQVHVFHSPFEDISSFGSITVMVFAFYLSEIRTKTVNQLILTTLPAIGAAGFVIASWSRATWLVATLLTIVIAMIKMPRKIFIYISCALAAMIIIFNLVGTSSVKHPYIWRLMSLVRFEKISNKDAGRFYLYKKGMRMVEAHPLLGNGIGSFYLTSTQYSDPEDPWAKRPDFGHNTFLQFAVELGLPAALLFFLLALTPIQQGWKACKIAPLPNSALFSVTAALTAYLLTQMTANSLNVYFSNQFLFWFLAALLVKAAVDNRVAVCGPQFE